MDIISSVICILLRHMVGHLFVPIFLLFLVHVLFVSLIIICLMNSDLFICENPLTPIKLDDLRGVQYNIPVLICFILYIFFIK